MGLKIYLRNDNRLYYFLKKSKILLNSIKLLNYLKYFNEVVKLFEIFQ